MDLKISKLLVPFGTLSGRVLIVSFLIGNLGSWIRAAALAAYFAMEGELVLFALFMMVRQGLQFLISPVIGVYVDRFNKKISMQLSLAVSFLSTILIAAAVLANMEFGPFIVLVLAATSAIFSLTFSAFMMTVVPLVFAKDQRPTVNSMLGGISTLALTLGPAISGVLLMVTSLFWIFVIDAIVYLIVIGLIAFLKIPRSSLTDSKSENESFLRSFNEGIRHVFTDKILLGLVLIGAASSAGVGATWILNPALVYAFELSPAYIGLVMSVIGVGSFVGITLGGILASKGNMLRNCIVFTLAFALIFMTWAAHESIFLGILLPAFFMGVFACVHEASYWTHIQNVVPPKFMGRAFTTIDSLALGGMFVGRMVAETAINALNPQASVILSGITILIFWFIGTLLIITKTRGTYRDDAHRVVST